MLIIFLIFKIIYNLINIITNYFFLKIEPCLLILFYNLKNSLMHTNNVYISTTTW